MQFNQTNWQSMQFSKMDGTGQNLATANIIREADNVNALYIGCSERAIKSLFLLNSGGAVTILAYIHNNLDSLNVFIKISLVIFLLGLVLAFDVVARDFYYIQKKSLEFHSDVRKFLSSNIPFNGIRRFQPNHELVENHAKITIKLGEISAYCIVWGIFFGLLGYFTSY